MGVSGGGGSTPLVPTNKIIEKPAPYGWFFFSAFCMGNKYGKACSIMTVLASHCTT